MSVPSDRASSSAIAAAAHTDDTEAVAWAFHPDHAKWNAIGVTSYTERQAWAAAGINLNDAAEYKRRKFNPEEAVRLRDAGITAHEARRTMSQKWRDLHGRALEQTRFTLDELLQWHAAGISLREAEQSKSLKFDLSTVERFWNDAGVTDPDLRKKWYEAGFRPTGDDSSRCVGPWVTAGITDPNEATQWNDVGYRPGPDEQYRSVDRWRGSGISPADVPQWDKGKYVDVDWAGRLNAAGVPADFAFGLYSVRLKDPDKVIRWCDAGFRNADDVLPWLRGGWSPEKAFGHFQSGYTAPDDLPETMRKRRKPRT